MITPGFFGLYNAYRGLTAAQNALSTINHNISNVNTPGYSRQQIDLAAYNAYSNPSLAQLPGGQIGQGPWVQQITRSRDVFLDAQFRQANGVSGMDKATRDALQQVEGILNEPSTDSLNASMQSFFDAAQELSIHPESTAVRADYIQHAIDMVTTFQQQANQLTDLRKNLVGDPLAPASFETSQLSITAKDVNDKLAAIAAINKNIVTIKASGAQPNDLMDQRDQLLDQLSNLVDIKVTNYDNGQIDVVIGGQTMIHGVDQMDSLEVVQNPDTGAPLPTADDVPALIQTVNGGKILNDGVGPDELSGGTLKGISDMGGADPSLSTVRNVLGKLDNLLTAVVNQINTLQTTGRDLDGNLGTATPVFQLDATLNPGAPLDISHWVVNQNLINNPRLLAAASDDASAPGGFAGTGDGRNALAMAQVRDLNLGAPISTNLADYLNGVVSKVGIDTRSFENSTSSQGTLMNSLDARRQSVSGVNVDEETIDLLRYQRAFEATSKVVSILDQVTQTIIQMV